MDLSGKFITDYESVRHQMLTKNTNRPSVRYSSTRRRYINNIKAIIATGDLTLLDDNMSSILYQGDLQFILYEINQYILKYILTHIITEARDETTIPEIDYDKYHRFEDANRQISNFKIVKNYGIHISDSTIYHYLQDSVFYIRTTLEAMLNLMRKNKKITKKILEQQQFFITLDNFQYLYSILHNKTYDSTLLTIVTDLIVFGYHDGINFLKTIIDYYLNSHYHNLAFIKLTLDRTVRKLLMSNSPYSREYLLVLDSYGLPVFTKYQNIIATKPDLTELLDENNYYRRYNFHPQLYPTIFTIELLHNSPDNVLYLLPNELILEIYKYLK